MTIRLVLAVSAFVGFSEIANAAPVLWAGNGHYYELIQPPAGINWTDAKVAAESSSYLGTSGHLATVTSAAEHNFLIASLLDPASPVGTGSPLFVFAWIGLREVGGEGDWQWVTGEPFSFTAWDSGEPSNQFGTEAWAHYQDRYGSFAWNDAIDDPTFFFGGLKAGYLVEYPVPEPSTVSLLLIGLCLLAVGRLRSARR